MNGYQTIKDYRGTLYGYPMYSGIEYDYEVPDNVVVTSPGGTSSTIHHYSKGFYGDGESSTDIYAGQDPRYPSGEYGNVYDMGESAATHEGYYKPSITPNYGNNESTVNPSFEDSFELIKSDDLAFKEGTSKEGFTLLGNESTCSLSDKKVNIYIIVLIIVLSYILLDFISSGTKDYLKTSYNSGKALSWKNYIMYSIVLVIILIIVVSISGAAR